MVKTHVEYSVEMMKNYLQAELISPQNKFEALQASDGHSLLFCVDSEGAFNLIQEQSGMSAAGWSQTDLSSAQIRKDFPGESGVVCRTFEAGQSAQDGSLGLAMVLGTNDGDRLYLCLGNSNKDTAWKDSPNWVYYRYDCPDIPIPKLEISNVLFCETANGVQYIIVDIVRDPESPVKNIHRFYIDPGSHKHHWNSHNLPIDIEADRYKSCLGRAQKGRVDGVYSAGHAGQSSQIVYCPVVNLYGSAPPMPVRLELPGGALPDCVAATRNRDLSTDLFVVEASTLYYFPSSNQHDGAVAAVLLSNAVMSGTSELFAMSHDGMVILWGRNQNDEVYYISCPQPSITDPLAWSLPVPILSGIERISPYINMADGGNTIFAAGGGKLRRIVQSDQTIWQAQDITLPIQPHQKAISFNSYTTTVKISDEAGMPLRDILIGLSADSRCTAYINGLYYALDRSPVHVKPDTLGTITIVQATGNLNGTILRLSTGSGNAVTINPMEKPFKKLAELNTPDKLKGACITQEDGSVKRLVGTSVPSGDIITIAEALGHLSSSYDSMTLPQAAGVTAMAPEFSTFSASGIANDIVVAAGDLFNWLATGVKSIVRVIRDAASAAWHFVAEIAGKVYRAVLDTVDAVVNAVEWLFNAIKTTIADIIRYVEFLFDWDDIKRTKMVLHNLVKRYLEAQVNGIQAFKGKFDKMIGDIEAELNTWAGVQDWSALGTAAQDPASRGAVNPMQGHTSGSLHLCHHYHNNARDLSITGPHPSTDIVKSLIDDLFIALEQEGQALSDVFDLLEKLAHDFPKLSLAEILVRLLDILAEGILRSTQVVIDALLNVLYDIANEAVQLLDTKIHIPIISDILNAIGVPDISLLDLFCWIAAVAITIVYKIVTGHALFPDSSDTAVLIDAPSFDDLLKAFDKVKESPLVKMFALSVSETEAAASSDGSLIHLSSDIQTAVFVTGHSIGSFCALMADFINCPEACASTGDNPYSIPSAVLGVVGGGAVGISNYLAPRMPIKNPVFSYLNTATASIRIICKLVFSSVLQEKFAASERFFSKLAVNDGRATGAVFDAILIIPAIFCTGWHFYELSEEPAGKVRSIAIIEEVSNLTNYISRFSYTLAVNTDDPEAKAVEVAAMAAANLVYSGLQLAEVAI